MRERERGGGGGGSKVSNRLKRMIDPQSTCKYDVGITSPTSSTQILTELACSEVCKSGQK